MCPSLIFETAVRPLGALPVVLRRSCSSLSAYFLSKLSSSLISPMYMLNEWPSDYSYLLLPKTRPLIYLLFFSDLLYFHDFVSISIAIYHWYSSFLNLTPFSSYGVQIMDDSISSCPDHTSFKQVLVFEMRSASFPKQDHPNPNLMEDPFRSSSSKSVQ